MADNYIMVGDVMFPKKYFHSMGLANRTVEGEDGKPTDQVVHVLRINLTEGQGFTVGGTRKEVEAAFVHVARQLGMQLAKPEAEVPEPEPEEEDERHIPFDKVKAAAIKKKAQELKSEKQNEEKLKNGENRKSQSTGSPGVGTTQRPKGS